MSHGRAGTIIRATNPFVRLPKEASTLSDLTISERRAA